MATIYLVEDSQSDAKLYTDALSAIDAQVIHFTSVAGFLGHLKADNGNGEVEPASMLILDLSLPDQDGIELLEQCRRDGHSMPTLLVSAHDETILKMAENLAEVWGTPIIAALRKPIDLGQFVDLVASQIQNA